MHCCRENPPSRRAQGYPGDARLRFQAIFRNLKSGSAYSEILRCVSLDHQANISLAPICLVAVAQVPPLFSVTEPDKHVHFNDTASLVVDRR